VRLPLSRSGTVQTVTVTGGCLVQSDSDVSAKPMIFLYRGSHFLGAMVGRQAHAAHAPQTWLRPPHAVVEKIEALLELGKSNSAIRNHHTMVRTQPGARRACAAAAR